MEAHENSVEIDAGRIATSRHGARRAAFRGAAPLRRVPQSSFGTGAEKSGPLPERRDSDLFFGFSTGAATGTA